MQGIEQPAEYHHQGIGREGEETIPSRKVRNTTALERFREKHQRVLKKHIPWISIREKLKS